MQIFANVESVIRLVGALLVEIIDEMIAAERRYIAAASVATLLDMTASVYRPCPQHPHLTAETHGPTPLPRDSIG